MFIENRLGWIEKVLRAGALYQGTTLQTVEKCGFYG